MKLDLLTNATVVDDAIRFVSEHGKSKDDMNYHQKERRTEEEQEEEQKMTNKVF
jgi:hypothetical protein